MQFKKQELDFLQLFNLGKDNGTIFNDKVHISASVETKEVLFALQANDSMMYKTMKNETISEDLLLNITIDQLSGLVQSVKDKDAIFTFTPTGIKFNKSKYDFEMIDVDVDPIHYIMKQVIEAEHTKVELKDLSKINIVKDSLGNEESSLNVIGIYNNHLVTSNVSDVTTITNTASEISSEVFIPEKMINLLTRVKGIDDITLNVYEEFYHYTIDEVNVINTITASALQDVWEISDMFMHPHIVNIDKEEFVTLLNRISLIASANLDERLHLTFSSNLIVLESKDENTGYAREEYITEVPAEVAGQEIIVSVKYLKNIFGKFIGTNVEMLIAEDLSLKDPEEEPPITVTFRDKATDSLYIHNLYNPIIED